MQGYDGARWPKTIGDHAWWSGRWKPRRCSSGNSRTRFSTPNSNIGSIPRAKRWKNGVTWSSKPLISWLLCALRCGGGSLCPGVPVAGRRRECRPRTTVNPTFELSYWLTGLRIAGLWRERLGLPAKAEYGRVCDKLSPLPVQQGVYVSWENIDGMWTRYNWEHPALIGAQYAARRRVDIPTMERTLMKVHREWKPARDLGWIPHARHVRRPARETRNGGRLPVGLPGLRLRCCGLVGGGRAPFPYFRATAGCSMPWR